LQTKFYGYYDPKFTLLLLRTGDLQQIFITGDKERCSSGVGGGQNHIGIRIATFSLPSAQRYLRSDRKGLCQRVELLDLLSMNANAIQTAE
jgi:hypothetical protein